MNPPSVFERQNEPEALTSARAFRRRYIIARRWRLLRVGTSITIGTVGVLVAFLHHEAADYVSALAAAWIVFSRTVLEPNEQRQRRHGAIAQELFDTEVFQLPWSTSATGPRPAPEDIRNWSHKQGEDELRDWYSDTRPAQHPVDVLLCQRATITWARQDHTTYAQVLRWIVGVVAAASLVLGMALSLSLAEYLLRLGVPVLPALLDILDVARGNSEVAAAKLRLESEADSLFTRARATATPPSEGDCRELQNGIFDTRLYAGVPSWMYRSTRSRRQQNMEDTVRAQVASLPPVLRQPVPTTQQ